MRWHWIFRMRWHWIFRFFLYKLSDHPLHRHQYGPPKFFCKTFKFSIIFYSTWQILGGSQRTLKEYFWCYFYCAHLGTPWYQIVGASRLPRFSEEIHSSFELWAFENDTPRRAPGLGQITWWIVMTQNWGAIRGKKLHGNQEIVVEWTVRVVGASGQSTQAGPKCAHSGTVDSVRAQMCPFCVGQSTQAGPNCAYFIFSGTD